jgi:hypothetical protein
LMGGLLTQLLFYQRRDSLFCFPYSFSQGNFTLTVERRAFNGLTCVPASQANKQMLILSTGL